MPTSVEQLDRPSPWPASRCRPSWTCSTSPICRPDRQHRVQRGHRLLEDVGDVLAAGGAQLASRAPISSVPSSRTEPATRALRGSSPARLMAVTLLPQPDSPTMADDLAGARLEVDACRRPSTVPVSVANRHVRSRTSSTGVASAVGSCSWDGRSPAARLRVECVAQAVAEHVERQGRARMIANARAGPPPTGARAANCCAVASMVPRLGSVAGCRGRGRRAPPRRGWRPGIGHRRLHDQDRRRGVGQDVPAQRPTGRSRPSTTAAATKSRRLQPQRLGAHDPDDRRGSARCRSPPAALARDGAADGGQADRQDRGTGTPAAGR